MKLIGIWVEHYRNMDCQLFALEENYRIEYGDSRKLKITYENTGISEIFFPNRQVQNIHLIIGRTGSGKTNLLDLLSQTPGEADPDDQYFVIYEDKKSYYVEAVHMRLDGRKSKEVFYLKSEYGGEFYRGEMPGDTLLLYLFDAYHHGIFERQQRWDLDTAYPVIRKKLYLQQCDAGLMSDYILKYIQNFFPGMRHDGSKHQYYYCCRLKEEAGGGGGGKGSLSRSLVEIFREYKMETEELEALLGKADRRFFLGKELKIGIDDIGSNEEIKKLIFLLESKKSHMKVGTGYESGFYNLSSGEEQFARIFASVEECIQRTRYAGKNVILLMDEPDCYLHPDLARRFVNILVESLQNISKKMVFQVILTSHSPFLLSDLPGECVTRMDIEPETGNVRVCKSEWQSFGNHLFTLLREGFFLDATMGEYAIKVISGCLQKVDSIYNRVQSEKRITQEDWQELMQAEKLSEMIGDSAIRYRIKNHIRYIKENMYEIDQKE